MRLRCVLVISTPSLPEDVRVCACVLVSQGRDGRRTRLGEAGCEEPPDVGATRALRESELCDRSNGGMPCWDGATTAAGITRGLPLKLS